MCYGNSGGPDLTADSVIVGITVGIQGATCSGIGLSLRLDRQWAVQWLNGEIQLNQPSS